MAHKDKLKYVYSIMNCGIFGDVLIDGGEERSGKVVLDTWAQKDRKWKHSKMDPEKSRTLFVHVAQHV